jgi:hypothetical protein
MICREGGTSQGRSNGDLDLLRFSGERLDFYPASLSN